MLACVGCWLLVAGRWPLVATHRSMIQTLDHPTPPHPIPSKTLSHRQSHPTLPDVQQLGDQVLQLKRDDQWCHGCRHVEEGTGGGAALQRGRCRG